MTNSVKQALVHAVTAHKKGKLLAAERQYRSILKAHPKHPDANHNLAILLIQRSRINEALVLLKIAIDSNPNIDQFWITYIDILRQANEKELASKAYSEAKKRGVNLKKLSRYKNYQKNSNDEPSDSELKRLLETYQSGQFDLTEELAQALIDRFPNHAFSWKVLGAALHKTGRLIESVNKMRKSVELAPLDAGSHSNLGVILFENGQLKESETSFRQAISIRHDYAEAHSGLANTLHAQGQLEEAAASYRLAISFNPNISATYSNFGVTLKAQGRLDDAERNFQKAISLDPKFPEAYNNLGNTLKALGRIVEAHSAYLKAIELKPDYKEALTNLGLALEQIMFNGPNLQLYPILVNILNTDSFTRPEKLASCVSSLLGNDPLFKDIQDAQKISAMQIIEIVSLIESLDQCLLFHKFLRICPISNLRLEKILTQLRKKILMNLEKMEETSKLHYFLSTLAMQNFINEYVQFQSEDEIQLLSKLEARISNSISSSAQPRIIEILCLATYRPLSQYSWSRQLESLNQFKEVKLLLIDEPFEEKFIKKNITVVGKISDTVSVKVREQYERNPYPRWIRLGTPYKAKSISEVCKEINLKLQSNGIRNQNNPKILIAGCGTGQNSIEAATRFSDCQVTAVDLSLASLAYAIRKSRSLDVENLSYLQSDILNLDSIEKKFDIIECSGVLHHMEEPIKGWKVLTNLLKPGGLMKIGLYSESARKDIVELREMIASQGLGTSDDEMRHFRESLTETHDEKNQRLFKLSDFYSLSEIRDLLFHSKEHRFTLLEIKHYLSELGLAFCGLENQKLVSDFNTFNKNSADPYDLENWHKYEVENPYAFIAMYQFWCQKT